MLVAIIIASVLFAIMYTGLWLIRLNTTNGAMRRSRPLVATSLGLWTVSYFFRAIPSLEIVGIGVALLCGIIAITVMVKRSEARP